MILLIKSITHNNYNLKCEIYQHKTNPRKLDLYVKYTLYPIPDPIQLGLYLYLIHTFDLYETEMLSAILLLNFIFISYESFNESSN